MNNKIPHFSELCESLAQFLHQLKLKDPQICQTIIAECLNHLINSTVLLDNREKNLRFVCNQAQQIFDEALVNYYHLNLKNDPYLVTTARAQLLCETDDTAFLFNNGIGPKLQLNCPAVPMESFLTISPQTLDFVFAKSLPVAST